MNYNLYDQFSLEEKKSKIFIELDNGNTFTYGYVHLKVAQYCCFFESLGLKAGDRIVQQTEKCLDALCVYLASLRFGTIYVPLNPAFQKDELSYFIDDAEPSLFICSFKNKQIIDNLIQEKNLEISLETLNPEGNGSIQKKIKNFEPLFHTVYRNENDIACILYTSGTTGRPKGAMLSHKNLLVNGLALREYWGFTENDTLLHMLPIFHCHGLFFACHCVLLSGSRMIFLPKFDVKLAIKYLPHSTVLMGVPTYYTRLLNSAYLDSSLTKICVFLYLAQHLC